MTTGRSDMGVLCSHCLLPLGRRPLTREIDGSPRAFCCYGCCLAYQVRHGNSEESEATWLLVRLGVGGFLAMNIMLLSLLLYSGTFDRADAELKPWIHVLLWILATPVLVILGGPFLRDTWRDAWRGRLTSSALILLGVAAAYAYSALRVLDGGDHVYFDTATMLLVLFTLGRLLDASGRARAVRSLGPLLEAERQWARVVEDGAERRRPVKELSAGTRIRVGPAERVPVDGTVVEGTSEANEAILTGESHPVAKQPGAPVIAGSINLGGPLLIEVSHAGSATRWAQICRAVRQALSERSPAQRLADLVAGAFVPIVLCASIATALIWSRSAPTEEALLTGLAVLVVACPCGLGLATGLAGSLAIARLARRGCLVRGCGALERLAKVRVVAFDKTGTLTLGRPVVTRIEVDGVDAAEVLARAAALEAHAEHAMGRGIVAAASMRGLAARPARDVRVHAGSGLCGVVEGEAVAAGRVAWMTGLAWRMSPRLRQAAEMAANAGCSVVAVGWGREVRAVIRLDDAIRPEAPRIVDALHRTALATVLVTGDLPMAARRVAVAVGIPRWKAQQSPGAKCRTVDALRREHGAVAMIGDGLNDGPVLAAADVGIAVGGATDLARETADLVLPEDGLRLLPWVVHMARATRRTIASSLLWAFGYNLVALSLAASGLLQPILAAGLMAGSSLIVVVNSLRLERVPEPAEAGSATTAMASLPRRAAGVAAAADA